MDTLGVFSEEANSSRVLSLFRLELNKRCLTIVTMSRNRYLSYLNLNIFRINTADMIRDIVEEIEGGDEVDEMAGYIRQDTFKLELQEVLDLFCLFSLYRASILASPSQRNSAEKARVPTFAVSTVYTPVSTVL